LKRYPATEKESINSKGAFKGYALTFNEIFPRHERAYFTVFFRFAPLPPVSLPDFLIGFHGNIRNSCKAADGFHPGKILMYHFRWRGAMLTCVRIMKIPINEIFVNASATLT